jgi:hypothetical protein
MWHRSRSTVDRRSTPDSNEASVRGSFAARAALVEDCRFRPAHLQSGRQAGRLKQRQSGSLRRRVTGGCFRPLGAMSSSLPDVVSAEVLARILQARELVRGRIPRIPGLRPITRRGAGPTESGSFRSGAGECVAPNRSPRNVTARARLAGGPARSRVLAERRCSAASSGPGPPSGRSEANSCPPGSSE